jgi:acetyl-CoA C-acetyltransferase
MTDVFIYDHVRTPRGRGKKDGSLHEVPSVRLAARVLEAVRDRNGLDTTKVDDIVMGCVDPVMDAGSVIPKARCLRGRLFDQGAPASSCRASAPPVSMP